MRDIKFIDHEPPAVDKKSRGGGGAAWSGFAIGVLTSQPGRWAIIESENAARDANLLRKAAENLGLDAEAMSREGTLYARVTS